LSHKFQFVVSRTVRQDVVLELEAETLPEAMLQMSRYEKYGERPETGTVRPVNTQVIDSQSSYNFVTNSVDKLERPVLH